MGRPLLTKFIAWGRPHLGPFAELAVSPAVVPWSPLHTSHPRKMLKVPHLLVRGPHPHPHQLLSQEPSQQKGIGTLCLQTSREPGTGQDGAIGQAAVCPGPPAPLGTTEPNPSQGVNHRLCGRGRAGRWTQEGKIDARQQGWKFIFQLGRGIYKEARREIRSYKHISAILLHGPFLD